MSRLIPRCVEIGERLVSPLTAPMGHEGIAGYNRRACLTPRQQRASERSVERETQETVFGHVGFLAR